MKLGVFGGTFDPIHTGHMIVAEEARVHLGLDEVLFVPAGRPWFKRDQDVTPARSRLEMVETAIEGNPYFSATDMEVERPGPSYTVDTLEALETRLGAESELFVMAGLDALKDIGRWRRPVRVLELCTLVGIARLGREELDRGVFESLRRGASEDVIVIKGPLIGISGTEIRERVAQGVSIRYSVPGPVEAYIYEHGLYTNSGRGASHRHDG